MALEPGTQFGAYDVAESIGAGGMGEVYRAKDTQLKRDVALKVLPQAFVEDSDRLARFQREAEILASLNHPNIAQVYGLEKADGQTAIVMELVEGPTLADRIKKGPLPPDEAIGIALQVVAALEAAHVKQIVHRDLKPANVKVRDDGTVKVLDFGISKPIDPAAISGGSPVMTTPAVTQTGVILGTAAYMSPEQARGKFVDQRTDIWAFGCLLFEMLTGQPAFGGEDVMLTLARVLDRATDLSSIPKTITPAVRHTLKLCLEKDPKQRISDIRDVRMALEGKFESEYQAEQAAAAARPLWQRAMPHAAVALIAGAIMFFVGSGLDEGLPEAEPVKVTRFAYELPAGQRLAVGGNRNTLAVSPDGSGFVFSTGRIYWRAMDSVEATPIRGASGIGPFFQPDARRIGLFGVAEALSDISLEGGVSRQLRFALRSEAAMTPRLATDGSAFWNRLGGVSISAAVDSEPQPVIEFDPALRASGAFLLPDGDTMVFTIYDPTIGIDSARIVRQSITSGDPYQELIPRGYDPRYLPTGHLLWVRDGVVWARAFDAATFQWQGEAVEMLSGVLLAQRDGALLADYDVASDGTLVYAEDPGVTEVFAPYVWAGFDGGVEQLLFPDSNEFFFPRLSPDGRQLAVSKEDESGGFDLWVYDFDRPDRPIPLTTGPDVDIRPLWTPDGQAIVFYRRFVGLYRVPANGTGLPELLWREHESIDDIFPNWIHPTEPVFAFHMFNIDERFDPDINPDEVPYPFGVYRLNLEGGVPERFPLESFRQGSITSGSALSPDQQWVSYTSSRSGIGEIYISPYPDATSFTTPRVSTDGGGASVWGPDGQTIYYRNSDTRQIMAVNVEFSPQFEASQPVAVSGPEANYSTGYLSPTFDIDFANRRVLMRRAEDMPNIDRRDRIIVIENWFEELKQRVPTD